MATFNPLYNEETGWAAMDQLAPWQQALMNPGANNPGMSMPGVDTNWLTGLPSSQGPSISNPGASTGPNFDPNTFGFGPAPSGQGMGLYPGMPQGPGYTLPGGGTNRPPDTPSIASPSLLANNMGMQGAQNVGGTGMYTGANAPLNMSLFAPQGQDAAIMSGSMGGFGEMMYQAAQQNGINPNISYLQFIDDLSRKTLAARGGQGGLMPQDFVNYLQSQGGQQWIQGMRPQTAQQPEIRQTGPTTPPYAPQLTNPTYPGGRPPQQNAQQNRNGNDLYGGNRLQQTDTNRGYGQFQFKITPQELEIQRQISALGPNPAPWGAGVEYPFNPTQEQRQQIEQYNQNVQRILSSNGMIGYAGNQSPIIGTPGTMGQPGQQMVGPGQQPTPEQQQAIQQYNQAAAQLRAQAQEQGLFRYSPEMGQQPGGGSQMWNPSSAGQLSNANSQQSAAWSQYQQQMNELNRQYEPLMPTYNISPFFNSTQQQQQQPQFSSDPAMNQAYMYDMYASQMGGGQPLPQVDFRAATYGGQGGGSSASTGGTSSGSSGTGFDFSTLTGQPFTNSPSGATNPWSNVSNRRSGFGGGSLFDNPYQAPANTRGTSGGYIGRPASYGGYGGGQSQRPQGY